MKFSICQINPSVGALKYNYEKIVKFYNKSISSGCDIIIFPELSITGYPPRDLLFEKKFIDFFGFNPAIWHSGTSKKNKYLCTC